MTFITSLDKELGCLFGRELSVDIVLVLELSNFALFTQRTIVEWLKPVCLATLRTLQPCSITSLAACIRKRGMCGLIVYGIVYDYIPKYTTGGAKVLNHNMILTFLILFVIMLH